MERGKFYVIEGIDGSGKSTQMELLSKQLSSLDIKHHLTTEPTDGQIGKLIRRILKKEFEVGEASLAGLFLADRLEHLQNPNNGMLKFIEAGTHVISDRYYWSSYAYHSLNLPMDWVIELNSICAEILKPHITFYLDLTPEESMRRIRENRKNTELFETHKTIEKVRNNYLQAIHKLGAREKVITINTDHTKSPKEVFEEIWSHLSKTLM